MAGAMSAAEDSCRGLRDRAILAALMYHGLRREEFSQLQLTDLRMLGKDGKIHWPPSHRLAKARLQD